MADPFDDPHLKLLLQEADVTLEVLRTQVDARERELSMASLDVIFRDLGRGLHDLWLLHSSAQVEAVDLEVGIEDLEEVDVLAQHGEVDDRLWLDSLQDMLALMEPPPVEESPAIIAAEAARVQWASVQLEERWARYPEAIQLALLGMVAARCRWLLMRLSCTAGPMAAMERLADYRHATGLATVVGLMLDHEPEYDSWTDDAVSWWGMLTAGFVS